MLNFKLPAFTTMTCGPMSSGSTRPRLSKVAGLDLSPLARRCVKQKIAGCKWKKNLWISTCCILCRILHGWPTLLLSLTISLSQGDWTLRFHKSPIQETQKTQDLQCLWVRYQTGSWKLAGRVLAARHAHVSTPYMAWRLNDRFGPASRLGDEKLWLRPGWRCHGWRLILRNPGRTPDILEAGGMDMRWYEWIGMVKSWCFYNCKWLSSLTLFDSRCVASRNEDHTYAAQLVLVLVPWHGTRSLWMQS